jgi:hypothetical protein
MKSIRTDSMRYTKVFGAVLLAGGIVVFLSSFLVELTIFSDDPGIGIHQIMGIITGSGAAIVGIILILARQRVTIVILKLLGIVLLVGGIGVLFGALLIDFSGFRHNAGFGLRQIEGTITGAVALCIGLFTLFRLKTMAR